MPELPEVETVCRRLATCLPGLVLDDIEINDPLVSAQSGDELRAALRGRRVVALRRRGKYVIIELEGVLLVVHLRMTGRLLLAPEPGGRRRRFVARFRPATDLLFYDTRRFGRVWAVPAADENRFFAALGPRTVRRRVHDRAICAARCAGRHGAAQIVPARPAAHRRGRQHLRRRGAVPRAPAPAALAPARSGPGEAQRLHDALLETLQLGIDHEGASIESFVDPAGERGAFQEILNVYGRTGEPCRSVRRRDRAGRAGRPRHAFLPAAASRCRAAGGWPPAAARRSRAGGRRARAGPRERPSPPQRPGGGSS